MTMELSLEPAASPAAYLRGLCGGNLHLPGDPGYDAARLPWNVAVDQRPAAVAFPRTAAEVGAVVRVAAEAGLRIAPQSTGHNAAPLAARGPRRRGPRTHVSPQQGRLRPDPRDRPGRGRRHLGAGRRRGRSARDGGAARLLARRRHRGLLAGRGDRLVRAQARPGHQQPDRGRAGHRRRHPGARRRHHQPRAVLGGPRRWRQLRRGHCAGVPHVPDRDGVRRHAGLGHHRQREGVAGMGGLGTIGSGRRDDRVPHPAGASGAGDACPASRPLARRDRRRRARNRRTRAGAVGRPAGPAPRDRHLRPGPGQVAGAAAHGPRGWGPVRVRHRDARLAPRHRDRRVPRRGRPRGDDLAAARRAPTAGRRAWPSARGRRGAHAPRRRVRAVRRRHRGHPGDGRAGPCGRGSTHLGAGAVRQRSPVPQLRGEPGRPAQRVRRHRVAPAQGHPLGCGPPRNLRGQPRRPAEAVRELGRVTAPDACWIRPRLSGPVAAAQPAPRAPTAPAARPRRAGP